MKKTLKDIFGITGICLIVLILYILLDIFDVPSHIGIPVERFNWDVASLLLSNLIVIALFAITYRALDKRSIQKEHNQRKIAVFMLRSAMTGCSNQANILKTPGIIKLYYDKNNDICDTEYQKLMTGPFSDHESIVSFALDGVISEEEFAAYDAAKKQYTLLVTIFFSFQNAEDLKKNTEAQFRNAIEKALDTINKGQETRKQEKQS